MKRVVAIIQARMNSSRLPGKILKKIGSESVLQRIVTRLRACKGIHEIVLATSVSSLDEAVAEEGARLKVAVFRGSEQDVLSRFYGAAKQYQADTVIRLTGDNPLVDPALIGQMLEKFSSIQKSSSVDYLSNALERSFPRGFETEIFSVQALTKAYEEALKPHEKEHVTPYFYQHPELFTVFTYRQAVDDSSLRLTLDTQEDFQLLELLIPELVKNYGPFFTVKNAVDVMKKHPEWVALNRHIQQKAV